MKNIIETQKNIDVITLQIPSLPENLRIIESFIDNVKEQYHISEDIYGNIIISVIECVNNAIIHGNKSNSQKNVELKLSFGDNYVKFSVKDEGNGFDYHSLPDPTSVENIEKVGGRGVFLMRHLADEVHFLEDGRQIELVFYV